MKLHLQAVAMIQAERARALASTTVIANELRRARRDLENAIDLRSWIASMRRDGLPVRQIRAAGRAAGLREGVKNLADVLFCAQTQGLGRLAVVEESNEHVLLRLRDCPCCGQGTDEEAGCAYVEGYLAGCLMACGRFEEAEAETVERDGGADAGCLFRIRLQRRKD